MMRKVKKIVKKLTKKNILKKLFILLRKIKLQTHTQNYKLAF